MRKEKSRKLSLKSRITSADSIPLKETTEKTDLSQKDSSQKPTSQDEMISSKNICQNICPNICPNICQNICPNMCQNICPNICQNIFPNICQNICPNISLNALTKNGPKINYLPSMSCSNTASSLHMGGSQAGGNNGSSLCNIQTNQNPIVQNILNPASFHLTQQMKQTINPQYAYPVYLILPVQQMPLFGFHL